jgi:putative membrane protein
MKYPHQVFAIAAGALLLASYAGAQTTTPDPSSPEAASSRHQREATGTTAPETSPQGQADTGSTRPSSSSTPHQREAMKSGSMEPAPEPGSTGGQDAMTFMTKAAQDGMTEVQLGKLAQKSAQSKEVRSFAEHMVTDHSKANDELKSLGKAKGFDAPKQLDAEHQAVVSKLSGKSGADFDAAYMDEMVKAHGKAIALFKGAQKSDDAEIAAFAKKTLPTLQEHKKMADSLQPKIKTASAESSNKE